MSVVRQPVASSPMATRSSELPPQFTEVPAPTTVSEAVASLHSTSGRLLEVVTKLERIAELQQETPEMRTVVINPGNNGVYQVIDRAAWPAKSIGIINPGAAPVFIGVGGVSARAGSRAPSCPGSSAMVLPVTARDLELGCDSAVLGADTAVVYVFRYVTVQSPSLGS
jgi:hypothetical protein